MTCDTDGLAATRPRSARSPGPRTARASPGWLGHLTDQERLRATVEAAGVLGPVAIILLLALAIVVSPVPSAPIGMVAGAVYGAAFGTVLRAASVWSWGKLAGSMFTPP